MSSATHSSASFKAEHLPPKPLSDASVLDLLESIVDKHELILETAEEIIVYLKTDPSHFERLREILKEALMSRSAPLEAQVYFKAIDVIFETLQKPQEKGGTIGLILPKALPEGFVKTFLRALDSSHLESVAFLGDPSADIIREVKNRNILVGSVKALKKQAVPTGVFDPGFQSPLLKELMMTFRIDLDGVSDDDTLAKDFAQIVMLAALIRAAGFIGSPGERGERPSSLEVRRTQEPGSLKGLSAAADAAELKQAVLQQLRMFENVIQLDGDGHFVVKAALAKAFAEEKARSAFRQAA